MSNNPYRSSNSKSRNTRQNQPGAEQVIVETIFKGIWELFKFIFGSKGPSKTKLDQTQVLQIREYWENVELHVLQEGSQATAVSEADKLLDAALQVKHIPGATLGERLKAAESHFPPAMYQELWQAHKLRNYLAHEVGAEVSPEEARKAISAFRAALYHLGILQ